MYTEPCISITPSRISLYNRVLSNDGTPYRRLKTDFVMPKSNKHNGDVSFRSAKRLKDKVNWLCYLAKNQKVTYPNGSVSENFKLSFITLTLPASQIHSDLEIKRVFNNFLTILRKRYGLKHYVWKAELQKNDNIHFHLTSTLFINHYVLRKVWNNCVNHLGYVSRYSEKFKHMSYKDYSEFYRNNCVKYKKEYVEKDCISAYNDGCKNEWRNPNSTDIKTVFKVKNLAAYLAKYLSKQLSSDNESLTEEEKEKQKERFEAFGNIWHCSRSLSKLTSYSDVLCNQWSNVVSYIISFKDSMLKEFDFCNCVYYSLNSLPIRLRSSIKKILDSYISNVFQRFDIVF